MAKCKMGTWLETACDEEDRESFDSWPGSMNKLFLMSALCGYKGKLTSLKQHVKQLCKCNGEG